MIIIKSKYDYPNFEKDHNCNVKFVRCCIKTKLGELSICASSDQFFLRDNVHPSEILRLLRLKAPVIVVCDLATDMPLCKLCGGSGKIDWAQRPRGRAQVKEVRRFVPEEQPKLITDYKSNTLIGFQFLPVLSETDKYCYDCGATGISFVRYDEVFGKILWYQNEIFQGVKS